MTFVPLENAMVLVLGGIQAHHQTQEELELFNPKTQSFQFIGKILRRWYPPAVIGIPDGKILILGRATTAKNSVNAEIYAY